jgi:hypothetical protein
VERRWNGWADDSQAPPFGATSQACLGACRPRTSAARCRAGRGGQPGPDSRLSPHPLVRTDPTERVRHARGQSFPDLVSLRSCRSGFPDGVSFPASDEGVRAAPLRQPDRCPPLPYGGGTSVTGHVNVLASETPVLTAHGGVSVPGSTRGSAGSGRASRRPTCATACGRWATRSTRSRPRPTGSAAAGVTPAVDPGALPTGPRLGPRALAVAGSEVPKDVAPQLRPARRPRAATREHLPGG